ncbi:hypothetical protein GCM10010168_75360 [Actinoplanes ianthinogenes]|uniref:Uncharacterized protein n=1 Tax=Actinoplanes ianthinogenes TaxID=122358 RepID=A0ABM7LRF6_9ACTN|nr:hypothetical protein [Actinoplanes ianthinogenes]BCJ41848.1 hypothetical protein Aiant_25050 [Actinoplanes ianthinogenes]GGR45528.1 hypothetical protein GCM10010168_75360 [Actinoplanes ianthinogenes]
MRSKHVIIGAGALAAVAAGATLATTRLTGSEHPTAAESQEVTADQPGRPGQHDKADKSDEPEKAAKKPQTADKRTREERIKAVREAAAKQTTKINYPLPPPPSGRQIDLHPKVTKTGGEVRRLYSARTDLTGQKELAWVTDDHQTIGAVSCTDKVRFSATTPAKARPTLLICWRISDARSVYTVAVDPDGKPSAQRSVAAVNAEWSRLA